MSAKKGKKLSVPHKAAIAAGLRKAVAKGWRPNTTSWPIGLAAITPEDRERATKKASATMAGRPQRIDTVCGKHTNHKNAKWWRFENKALGAILDGKNLNQLVRDNETLFNPKDLIWDACGCNASRCLRILKNSKKTNNSWKGWFIHAPNPK